MIFSDATTWRPRGDRRAEALPKYRSGWLAGGDFTSIARSAISW
jgi:hypothetical protein